MGLVIHPPTDRLTQLLLLLLLQLLCQ